MASLSGEDEGTYECCAFCVLCVSKCVAFFPPPNSMLKLWRNSVYTCQHCRGGGGEGGERRG